MSTKKYTSVKFILDELISLWNLKGYPALAEYIGVPYQTLMAWKKRDSIGDYAPFMDKGISRAWLTSGTGPPIVAETAVKYGVSHIIQGLTPEESELIQITRNCPEAAAVVKMMGAVDSDTQKDIQRSAEKEKLMYDLMKERNSKKSA